MKRFLILAILTLLAIPAIAQTPTTTTPQTVTIKNFFNAVTTAQVSSSLTNLGQTMHFLFYSATGSTGNPTGVKIRLEGSFDGTTFIPISDDGTDPPLNGSNMLLAIGAYPFIRVNLANCTTCNANNSITASYVGMSSTPGNPFGTYGAGQQIRKVLFTNQSTDGNATSPTFVTPYGSAAGFVLVFSSGAFPTGSQIGVNTQDLQGLTDSVSSYTIPTGAFVAAFPISASPATSLNVSYTSGGVVSKTFFGWYFFYPPGSALPGGAQPAFAANSEATATNATVTTTLTTDGLIQRAHLFSVDAKCSAGTATLTVKDGANTLYTSPTGGVGTTNFTKAWNPGLASSPTKNMVITLSTCGAANVGTLDVQGSVF